MELNPHSFLEELLEAPRRESWGTFSAGANDFFSNNNNNDDDNNGWNNFEAFDESTSSLATAAAPNPSFLGFSTTAATEPTFECPFSDQLTAASAYPFIDGYSLAPDMEEASPFLSTHQEDNHHPNNYPPSMVENEDFGLLGKLSFDDRKKISSCSSCKVEMEQAVDSISIAHHHHHHHQDFNMGFVGEKIIKSRSKKLEGQPSKNLMAERRRRKRLNDRLSMLRSVVPKISKMDRTSILGDTIDYMKELLERINKLQEEESEEGRTETDSNNFMINFRDHHNKPVDVLVRNSPKFQVERREIDTRIDICCSTKPGLLLSTVNTLEALGLEIQQCVISCFNDFSMQASCAEDAEQRTLLSPEDIKQALFRTAGYGGKCL